MTMQYRTVEGDTIDIIAFKAYAQGRPAAGTALFPDPALVAAILKVNPGLASYGSTLPAGLVIALPPAPAAAPRARVTLW